jgi:transketolase
MTAAHYRLDTLTAIVDRNELQAMGRTEERMGIEPLVAKWQAFGWEGCEIDGHDMGEICRALDAASEVKGRPAAIIAHTVKGKGVPFMEGRPGFHNVMISEEQFRAAAAALEDKIASFRG